MTQEMRDQLGEWMRVVEQVLCERGVLRSDGTIGSMPGEVEYALDGFIERPDELFILVGIGRVARQGRRISPATLAAAHMLAREVHSALAPLPPQQTRPFSWMNTPSCSGSLRPTERHS